MATFSHSIVTQTVMNDAGNAERNPLSTEFARPPTTDRIFLPRNSPPFNGVRGAAQLVCSFLRGKPDGDVDAIDALAVLARQSIPGERVCAAIWSSLSCGWIDQRSFR